MALVTIRSNARQRVRVLSVGAVCGAVVATALATAAPVAAATQASPDAAAGWLAGQYVDGSLSYGGSPNSGMTLDGILALTSRKVASSVAAAATDAFAANAASYISPTGGSTRSAGAVAKVALVAQAQNRDATNFGGEDLLATLESLKSSAAPNVGRYRDAAGVGGSDWSGSFSQSLALLVTSRAGAVAPDAVEFLINLQCDNGGFPYSPNESTGKCSANSDADNDATAMAVQALTANGVAELPGAATAAAKAADFLAAAQAANGSFDAPPWVGQNANTTGLAGQALRLAGRTSAADRATAWLSGLQLNCENAASGTPAAIRGVIAYDNDSLATLTSVGADSAAMDQLRFTQTQAVFGFPGSDGFATMSATGASAAIPSLSCGSERTAPLAPTVASVKYTATMKSAKITTSSAEGVDTRYRVKKGSSGPWSQWKSAAAGQFSVSASKVARSVEIKAANAVADSPTVTVLVQARKTAASRRGCQGVGSVTITQSSTTRATASFSKRKKSCASWRSSTSGRWKAVKKGSTSVSFNVPSAVGVNWQIRTGLRVVAISVRAPR